MTISAYPLQWPEGWPRTNSMHRKAAKFSAKTSAGAGYCYSRDLTVTEAVQRVMTELEAMRIDRQDVVISTNVRTRLDGLPRSGEREPDDPGAAVYWETRQGDRRVMAIDLYSKVYDNLAAIAATLSAMRAIERHGGAQILDRAFTGFVALPAPNAGRQWFEVLGVDKTATHAECRAAYRALAAANHPDIGGDPDRMTEINRAWEEAQEVFA